RCRAVLRIERDDEDALAALRDESAEFRCDRGMAVAHRPVDQEVGAQRLERAAELFGLRAGNGLEGGFVLFVVPDFGVIARLSSGPDGHDDAVENELPQRPLILDHPRIGEKFLEIAAHRGRIGGLRGAKIDQQHPDLADRGPRTIGRGGWRRRGGEGFVHGDAAYAIAAAGACMLSTQPHRIGLQPCLLAMFATRRFAAGILLIAILSASSASAETARVTFILVNDIYLMADQMMPDGARRGGFARLAAVFKRERAKGGNVIFAHAGDTLSPSLMSGLDRGARIVTLTNLIAPDIFAPGNHEFDFGKATYLQRMAEAKFPLYAANLRGADGQPLPNFKDRSITTVDGVHIGLIGATYDDTPRTSSPEDLKFLPTVAATKDAAEALRREGADFVVAVVHASREQDYAIFDTRAVDLVLS